jgi:N-acetylmuramoyl-L-alanine amidase/LGFP repeat
MTRRVRSSIAKLATLAVVATAAAVAVTTGTSSVSAPADAAQAAPGARPAVRSKVAELRLSDASTARPARLDGRSTSAFSLLGITWQPRASDGVLAQVRVRAGGQWTGWQTLAVDGEHGPDSGAESGDAAGRDGTEPLWVGSADGVQARVATTDGRPVRDVRVSLIDPGAAPEDAASALDAAATGSTFAGTATGLPAPYPRPAIVNRAGWGADESLRSFNPDCNVPKLGSTIKAAFVHHTAGSNTYTSSQSAGLIRSIYAYHVQGRGWCDIGYNFLVDKYGRIFEGRYGGILFPVIGAHTENYNTDSFGVSLMGDFTSTEPTAAIMESAAKVIAWKLDGHYRDPKGTVVMNGTTLNVISGHRDTKATECPGTRVYALLPALRSRVWALMGSSVVTEIYNFASQNGGFTELGEPYYLEHSVPGGWGTWFGMRDVYWSPGTGVHSVLGEIRTLHRGLGNAGGVLGLPAAEQHPAQLTGALVQEFSKAGAQRAVYWSSSTGAREVLDAIYTRYVAMGSDLSKLGLPTTGQLVTHVAGGRANLFQHGRMYYGPATGTHPIIGAFNTQYVQPGVYTQLGLPTTDEYAVTGGSAQDFQGGRITRDAATEQTTVTYNAAGPATRMTAPTFSITLAPRATIQYAATDADGVASYDVRYRRSSLSGSFGGFSQPWTGTTATSVSLGLVSGYEYCVSARARDTLGKLGPWSAERCFARPVDDRSLTAASTGWTRATWSAFYLGTATHTSRYGASLTRAVQAKRLYLVATRCPTCGTVSAYLNDRYIGAVDLYSTTTVRQSIIALPTQTAVYGGTLRITTRSTGKLVQIDGLGVRRT